MLDDQVNFPRREFLMQSGRVAIAAAAATAVSAACIPGCNSSDDSPKTAPPAPSTTGKNPVTAIVYDPAYAKHFAGAGHPESPRRLEAIMSALNETDFAGRLDIVKPRDASDDEILAKAHRENWILITNDKDFGEMVFRERRPHHGVVFLRLPDERASSKIDALRKLLRDCADRLPDAFVVVTDTHIRFAAS